MWNIPSAPNTSDLYEEYTTAGQKNKKFMCFRGFSDSVFCMWRTRFIGENADSDMKNMDNIYKMYDGYGFRNF